MRSRDPASLPVRAAGPVLAAVHRPRDRPVAAKVAPGVLVEGMAMMDGPEKLAVRQARDGLALGRELTRDTTLSLAEAEELIDQVRRPCSWGDDAWHRAVSRLIRLHRPDYRRLLAEERAKTGGQP